MYVCECVCMCVVYVVCVYMSKYVCVVCVLRE